MIRKIVLVGALCLLAACGRGHKDQAGAAAAKPGFPSLMMFRPRASAAPDSCGARSLAWLVGKPRTAIPVPADLDTRRVACTTCPASGDTRPDRTDILFDDKSGLITEVTCG